MVQISKGFADEMIAHALEDDPNECCGILGGANGSVRKLYRMTNVEGSPYRFNMDTKELYQIVKEMDDNEWDIMIIYHSHTHSEAYPSATDVRLANYPEAYYVLISLMDKEHPTMRAFQIVDGVISEEPLDVK